MTEDWIWLWFRCLKLNQPYKQYCEARRTKGRKQRAALESQYKRIEEIYDDFGDIHEFNERKQNRKQWFDWLAPRRHLFIEEDDRNPELLTQVPSRLDSDYLYLKIPVRRNVTNAISEATDLIRRSYPKVKNVGPVKYKLTTKVPSDRALRSLRKALNVWHKLKPLGKKAPKHKELVILLSKGQVGRKDDWDWTEDRLLTDKLDEFVLDGNDSDLIRQVMRYRQQAQHIIDNTVHGVFPLRKSFK